MALTPSTMLPLGTQAPSFELPDPDGQLFHLPKPGEASGTLIAFWCNHCPYVKLLKEHFSALTKQLQESNIRVFAINANDPHNYPEDGADPMRAEIRAFDYSFPYLIDAAQQVAIAYQAACTPDFFLFDGDLKLVYRGQYDDARPGNGKDVTGKNLKAAVEALLNERPPLAEQLPSIGCNIKWKPGQAPAYNT
jgi:peroxiredoxin